MILVFSSVGVVGVQAAGSAASKTGAQTVPGPPTILVVNATKGLAGAVTLTVEFVPGRPSRKTPILQTVVFADDFRCVAKRTARFCRIKTKAGANHVLRARSRTKAGFGEWSEAIQFEATVGNWWKGGKSAGSGASSPKAASTTVPRGGGETSSPVAPTTTAAMASTTTLPPARVDASRTKILTTSTAKLDKIEGLNLAQVAVSAARNPTVAKFAPGDVVFRSVGIVALAQLAESNRTGSKLLALAANGAVADALLSGTAVVDEFMVAPNGRYYVVFENRVVLRSGEQPCLLVEVDPATGAPRCIDESLQMIQWSSSSEEGVGNRAIQFDSEGNIYYVGYAGGEQLLRRASRGSVVDYINGNISVSDFLVLPDGDVLVRGQTRSSGVSWIRRYNASGGLVNLVSDVGKTTLSRFVDGNVYVGWGGHVKKYLTTTKLFEDRFWITKPSGTSPGEAAFPGSPWCDRAGTTSDSLVCSAHLDLWKSVSSIMGRENYVVLRSPRILMKYYPTVERANSVVTDVTSSQAVITNIILAGRNSAKKQVMTVYDTSSKQETVVLDETNEIEVYSMSYVPSTNSVMFSGLRFSDNKFVIGEVSLS